MNLPEWITAIALSFIALVGTYWAVAMVWISFADLHTDIPWWLRPLDKIAAKYYRK